MKLTPPAPQNANRRRAFFQEHPAYPGASAALTRIDLETKGVTPWWTPLLRKAPVKNPAPSSEMKMTAVKESTKPKGIFSRVVSKFMPKRSQRGN